MKLIFGLVTVLFSLSVNAETLICQQWGYANSPEGFHDIKLEPVESKFYISPTEVVKHPVGTTFSKVNPEDVGLGDIDVKAYKLGLELLYIYKDKGAVKVGISHLVTDSDVFFGDKELYSDCSFEKPEGGRQHVVASESLFAFETGGARRAKQVYRF